MYNIILYLSQNVQRVLYFLNPNNWPLNQLIKSSFDSKRDYNLRTLKLDRILLIQKTRACTRTERERGSPGYGKIMTQFQGVYNLNYLVNANSSCCKVFITAALLLVTSEPFLIKAPGDGLPDITKRAKQAP